MGAADRLRIWGGKVRANPWLAVGIAAGALLVCAWIGWAIHVTSDNGARQGLGVLIVWPAILAVVALVSIPFVWAFRVIRSGADTSAGETSEEPSAADAEHEDPGEEDEPEEEADREEDGGSEDEESEDTDSGEEEPEAEASAKG